jgi:hypothetical protein
VTCFGKPTAGLNFETLLPFSSQITLVVTLADLAQIIYFLEMMNFLKKFSRELFREGK